VTCWWRLLVSDEGMLAVDFRLPKPRPLKREFREFNELIRNGWGMEGFKEGRRGKRKGAGQRTEREGLGLGAGGIEDLRL